MVFLCLTILFFFFLGEKKKKEECQEQIFSFYFISQFTSKCYNATLFLPQPTANLVICSEANKLDRTLIS